MMLSTFRNATRAPIAVASALSIGVAAALAMGTTAANAVEILSFGQATPGQSPMTATANPALGQTTISTTNASVSVTSCLGCGLLGTPELLTLDAVSISPASKTPLGNIEQAFSGNFSIFAGGANVLSGTFTDGIVGSGTSLTLTASNAAPGQSLTFTSSVISAFNLGDPKGMSLSFADVTPAVGMIGSGTLATITSSTFSVSGTFSANDIPELSTWGMMLLGFAGLGFVGLRSTRGIASIID